MYGAHIQLNIFTMILYYCYGALLELRRRDLEMVPVMQGQTQQGASPHPPPPGPKFFLLGIFWAFNSWASSLSKPWPPLANLAQAAQTQAQLKKIKNPLIHITYKPNSKENERERERDRVLKDMGRRHSVHYCRPSAQRCNKYVFCFGLMKIYPSFLSEREREREREQRQPNLA